MQILVTHGTLARTRVLRLNRWQLLAALAALVVVLMALSGTIYHAVFLKAAREGWPVVSQIVRLVVRDEFAQRDRFMRENLDAMAQKVGEMQAKVVKLEAISERVSGLAGVKPEELQQLFVPPAVPEAGRAGLSFRRRCRARRRWSRSMACWSCSTPGPSSTPMCSRWPSRACSSAA